jgi:hypothetical protein
VEKPWMKDSDTEARPVILAALTRLGARIVFPSCSCVQSAFELTFFSFLRFFRFACNAGRSLRKLSVGITVAIVAVCFVENAQARKFPFCGSRYGNPRVCVTIASTSFRSRNSVVCIRRAHHLEGRSERDIIDDIFIFVVVTHVNLIGIYPSISTTTEQ